MAREMLFLGCPFCGWHRPAIRKGIETSFTMADPSQLTILSTRVFTGSIFGKRGGGIRVKSKILLKDIPNKYKEQIREQAQKILDELDK